MLTHRAWSGDHNSRTALSWLELLSWPPKLRHLSALSRYKIKTLCKNNTTVDFKLCNPLTSKQLPVPKFSQLFVTSQSPNQGSLLYEKVALQLVNFDLSLEYSWSSCHCLLPHKLLVPVCHVPKLCHILNCRRHANQLNYEYWLSDRKVSRVHTGQRHKGTTTWAMWRIRFSVNCRRESMHVRVGVTVSVLVPTTDRPEIVEYLKWTWCTRTQM